MKVPTETLIELWIAAAQCEFGIRFNLNEDVVRATVNDLYRARNEAGDPGLKEVKIMTPVKGEIWLVRETVTMEDVYESKHGARDD